MEGYRDVVMLEDRKLETNQGQIEVAMAERR